MASQPPSNPYQFESQTPYAAAPQIQTSDKPKAIKVFGILNVIFGGLGSSYLPAALVYCDTGSGVEIRVWLGWHTASSQQSLPRS